MKNIYKNSIKSLVSESMSDGVIDSAKITKVLSIIKSLPYPHNGIILKAYAKAITSEIQTLTLTLTTAHRSSDVLLKQIKQLFVQPIYFEEKIVNPNVLGGFRAQLGSQVIDMTVQEQIRQLEGQIL
jgi:hypothetical protein